MRSTCRRALLAGALLAGTGLAACSPERPVEVSAEERPGSGDTSTSTGPAPAPEPTATTAAAGPTTTTGAPTTTTTGAPACAPTGPFGPYVFDVHLGGPSRGLVAGTGTIRSTSDGGATWTAACLPESTDGYVVALAVRGDRAWAAGTPREGGGAFLLRSTDAGSTWTDVALPPGANSLKDITFPDDDHGWAVGQHTQTDPAYGPQYGDGALLLRTTDGGVTWTLAHAFDPDVAAGLNRLSFSDPRHGWAVGQTRTNTPALLATADGGDTWEPRSLPAGVREVHGVAFVDERHGWITAGIGPDGADSEGAILATADGGGTWTVQWRGAQSPVSALFFADTAHGWVVSNPAEGGTVLRTGDGGATWTATLTPGRALGAIAFTDTRTGWVAGQQGAFVYATGDGGATWDTRPITAPGG